MRVDKVTLFVGHEKGEIRANRVGAFVKGGESFDVIRPGYDIQGRRRIGWTQVCHGGVPIFDHKLQAPLEVVMERFDRLWAKAVGTDTPILKRALDMTKAARLSRYRDGVTTEGAAPALTRDGRGHGQKYVR